MKFIQIFFVCCSRLVKSLIWQKQAAIIWPSTLLHRGKRVSIEIPRSSKMWSAKISSDITYQVNYVEENLRKSQDKWSFRHTGVYHHHTLQFDLFIILHPNNYSVLEGRLLKLLKVDSNTMTESNVSQLNAFREDPYRLHLLVMSSFFDNWRWYLRYLGESFKIEVCRSSPYPSWLNDLLTFCRIILHW
jgi:hypothetical protein